VGGLLKRAVLTSRVTKVVKRFFGVPEFHSDALADGLRVLLSRLGMNCVRCRVARPATASAQLPPFQRRIEKTGNVLICGT